MKSYLIFAIVLTVAYIIYYAVIIAQELYGKKGKKRQRKRYSTWIRLRKKASQSQKVIPVSA